MHTNLIHVCLSNHLAGKAPVTTRLDIIYKQIFETFGFNERQLRLKSRKPDIVHARQAFCYLARKCAQVKFTDIGKELGQDHTSVMSAIRSMENKMATNYNNSMEQMNRLVNNIKFSF